MSLSADIAAQFQRKLIGGSEDELHGALIRHSTGLRWFATFRYASEETARTAGARLVEAGAAVDYRTPPSGHEVDARFHWRLARRIARIAFETGGRLDVPHYHPESRKCEPPHSRATDVTPGYVVPKSLATRVEHAAEVAGELAKSMPALEYLVTGEGKHVLLVNGEVEIPLDGLTAEQRAVFERLDDFLTLTDRLGEIVL